MRKEQENKSAKTRGRRGRGLWWAFAAAGAAAAGVILVKSAGPHERATSPGEAAPAAAPAPQSAKVKQVNGALDAPPDKAVASVIANALRRGSDQTNRAPAEWISLLQDPDEATARGAVRGMAAGNPATAMRTLGEVLYENKYPVSVRAEAALSLGSSKDPGALPFLTKAALEIKNEQVATHVLQAIGEHPFAQTEAFYSSYLESPSLGKSLRVAALESIGQAEGDPGAFLLKFAADQNAEVRAAAAWAMSAVETQGQFGSQLSEWLSREQDPEVRTRLYQALGNQESCEAGPVAAALQVETEMAPRLAGYALLAGLIRADASGQVRSYFIQNAIPQLQETALKAASAHDRLASVMALQRARIPEAVSSLQQIAQTSADPKIVAAARAGVTSGTRR